MSTDIYRKVSLERLSSPEQLDTLLTVTSPKGWVALAAAGIIVLSAILWGILGSVPVKLGTHGILLKSGGIQRVVSGTSGQITDIRVVADDFIQKGQVIARVAQPDLIATINSARNQLASLQGSGGSKKDLQKLQEAITKLEIEMETAGRVVSSYSGRIVEVKVSKGDFISPGMPVVSMELSGDQIKDLEAVFFVKAGDAKKISPGMTVNISPVSVKKEEYGLLQGRVTSVPKYPSTFAGMMQTLGNEELVRDLSGLGASVEVRVDLIPDSGTVSGYKWTTAGGPPVRLNTGTLVQGSVVLKTQRPLALIFPQFD